MLHAAVAAVVTPSGDRARQQARSILSGETVEEQIIKGSSFRLAEADRHSIWVAVVICTVGAARLTEVSGGGQYQYEMGRKIKFSHQREGGLFPLLGRLASLASLPVWAASGERALDALLSALLRAWWPLTDTLTDTPARPCRFRPCLRSTTRGDTHENCQLITYGGSGMTARR